MTRRDNQHQKHHLRATPKAAILNSLRHTITIQIVAQFSSRLSRYTMIDSDLHKYILEATDRSCKVIYLGDHCQMAPVLEKISPIYANPKRLAKLSEPMRNAGQPALMALCSQLRDTVETLRFHPIQSIPGVIDHLDDQQAYDFVENTFRVENPSDRILAFSNARVQEYHQHIREFRGKPAHFAKGDVLINIRTRQIGAGRRGNVIPADSEIEIISADTKPSVLLADSRDKKSGFAAYTVRFRVRGSSTTHSQKVPVDIERLNFLAQYYASRKDWDRVSWLRNSFPDFRQRDASTVHKAQGSTFETIFLDLTNIGSCRCYQELARLLYVGASRATQRVVLYGQLPKRLFV